MTSVTVPPDLPADTGSLRPGLRRGLARYLFASRFYPLTLPARAPAELAAVPPDLWPGDAEWGARLVFGAFRVGGLELTGEGAPWDADGLAAPVLADLHSFEWLRDLRAMGGDAARRRARQLTEGWMARYDRWDPLIWRPDVLGRRLFAWLQSHDFFIASAADDFRDRLFRSLSRQVRHLGRDLPDTLAGPERLAALKGLVAGHLALDQAGRVAQALALVDRTAARQLLPDGGHAARNPAAALDALRHLVDLRALVHAARQAGHACPELPETVRLGIDRLGPAVRMLRHADGGFALFNGADEGRKPAIDAVLAQTAGGHRPLKSAHDFGFERVLARRTLAIMDTGGPPPAGLDRMAHAAPLAFELSVGRQRLIVNCGAATAADLEATAWPFVLRGTAAHSTVQVAETNALAVMADGGLDQRPVTVTASRIDGDGGTLIDASHDAYRPRLGFIHRRRLFVADAGDAVRGEDTLMGLGAPVAFVARFHLHPSVKVALLAGGTAVLLRPPVGPGWKLSGGGATLALEESVYLGDGETRRRTSQITLTATSDETGGTLTWALSREARV